MRGTAVYLVTAAAVIAATLLAIQAPIVILIALVGVVGIAFIRHPVGRLTIFIAGGLLAMGGDSGLGATKLAYAAAVILCFVFSWLRVGSASRDPKWARSARYATTASILIVAVLIVAVGIGIVDGRGVNLVGQDAFTYLLIAVAPIIGLDAGMTARARPVLALAVIAGSIASVSWAVWWLARRGSQVGGLDRLALVTSFLGIAVFAIALVMMINAATARTRVLWGILAIAIPTTYIVAGSRSMLVFAVGFIGLLGLKKAHGRLRPLPFITVVAILLAAGVAVVTLIIPLLPDGPGILDRFSRTFVAIDQDTLAGDGSFEDRTRAYAFTWEFFRQAPLFGQGFGLVYPSVSGRALGDLKVDSPVLVLSKFGILGTLAIAIAVVLVWLIVRENRGPGELRLGETAFRIFVLVSALRSLFVAPTEEKGFAYSLAILIAFAVAIAHDPGAPLKVTPTVDGTRHVDRAHRRRQSARSLQQMR